MLGVAGIRISVCSREISINPRRIGRRSKIGLVEQPVLAIAIVTHSTKYPGGSEKLKPDPLIRGGTAKSGNVTLTCSGHGSAPNTAQGKMKNNARKVIKIFFIIAPFFLVCLTINYSRMYSWGTYLFARCCKDKFNFCQAFWAPLDALCVFQSCWRVVPAATLRNPGRAEDRKGLRRSR